MAGNDYQIDVQGVRRGRCQRNFCQCPEFSRRANSVACICGHTGLQHTAIVLCRGGMHGDVCDCQGLKSPPVPYNECLGCGHAIELHGGGIENEGGTATRFANRTAISGAGVNDTLGSAHAHIRQMVSDRREADRGKSVLLEDARSLRGGFSRGGRRAGSGRKPFLDKGKKISVTPVQIEERKPTLTRIESGWSRMISMKGDFTLDQLKEACRREFTQAMNMDMVELGDRVFRRMNGSEVFDGASAEDLAFTTCYYYNPAFHPLQPYKPKRRSEDGFVDDEGFEDDGGAVKRRRDEIERIGDVGPMVDVDEGEHLIGLRNGGEGDLLIGRGNGSGSPYHIIEDLEIAREEVIGGGGDFLAESEITKPSTMAKPSQISRGLSERAEQYGIEEDLAMLLLDFCDGDLGKFTDWLHEVLFGGDRCSSAVKELHRYSAFGEREGEGDDDMVYIKVRSVDDDGRPWPSDGGPTLRHQILLQWKKNKDQFHKRADVKFDKGIGDGPRNNYLQAIRECILEPLFEGSDDHRIVTAATDRLMDREYFMGGQFMGHIARHGQFVLAGLANVMKCAISGTDADHLFAAMEDLPSFDMQELLRKVAADGEDTLDGGEGVLTDADNQELTSLINESGVQSGHVWMPATANRGGYFKISNGESAHVVGHIVQYQVLLKRMAQIIQLVDGFESVCKLGVFLKLCGGVGGATIANALLSAYFPCVNECSMTKDQLSEIVLVEANGDDYQYHGPLSESILEVIEKLDDDPTSRHSVSKFIQLCTGCITLPLGTRITFKIVDHCDFKVDVCSKTVNVSKRCFESEEKRKEFVLLLLTEVSEAFQAYNKY